MICPPLFYFFFFFQEGRANTWYFLFLYVNLNEVLHILIPDMIYLTQDCQNWSQKS